MSNGEDEAMMDPGQEAQDAGNAGPQNPMNYQEAAAHLTHDGTALLPKDVNDSPKRNEPTTKGKHPPQKAAQARGKARHSVGAHTPKAKK